MRSNLIDLDLWLHHETAAAILVSNDGDRKKAEWLPKSAIEFEPKDGSRKVVVVTLPEPLAIDKRLV